MLLAKQPLWVSPESERESLQGYMAEGVDTGRSKEVEPEGHLL